MPETDLAATFGWLDMSLRRYAPPFVDREPYSERGSADEAAA